MNTKYCATLFVQCELYLFLRKEKSVRQDLGSGIQDITYIHVNLCLFEDQRVAGTSTISTRWIDRSEEKKYKFSQIIYNSSVIYLLSKCSVNYLNSLSH